MAPILPDKRPGKTYAIVLRSPSFSHGQTFRAGAVGGTFAIPLPTFGDACVCCDVPAGGRTLPLPIATDRYRADPIRVPVCPACTEHALGSTSTEMMIGSLMCVGIGGALWGFTGGLWQVGAGGLLVLLLCVGWLLWRRKVRLDRTVGGHHPDLQVLIAPAQSVVRTSNRRLAQHIAETHADLVHRIR
jgi:hypothetical protein